MVTENTNPNPVVNGNGGKMAFPQKLAPTKLKLQTLVILAFLAVDAGMFWQLVERLRTSDISASTAALLGILIGAVTTSLGLAAKDYFNPGD